MTVIAHTGEEWEGWEDYLFDMEAVAAPESVFTKVHVYITH